MNEDARVVPAAAAYERRRHREHGVQILELTVSHVYGHVLERAGVGVLDVGQVEDVRHTSASAVTQPRERATSRDATNTAGHVRCMEGVRVERRSQSAEVKTVCD